jgi:sec-independent protein translocase protein TatA
MIVLANILNLFDGPQGIFILLLVLLLFGAKKLPELARGMGQALKEFKKAKDEFSDELHKGVTTEANREVEIRPAPATLPRTAESPAATAPAQPAQGQTTPSSDQPGKV